MPGVVRDRTRPRQLPERGQHHAIGFADQVDELSEEQRTLALERGCDPDADVGLGL